MEVFAIAVPAVVKLFKDDSHLITVPLWPDKVSVVLLVPGQTVVPPATVPPTEAGVTVIIAGLEFAGAQLPL